MSLLPNTSPLLLNINIGSKYFAMFVSFLKHTPLKLILYLFINKIYIKKNDSVNVCLVLQTQGAKKVSFTACHSGKL